MKILLTGKSGQVGYELERHLRPLGEVIALGRKDMDLSDLAQVREIVRTVRPSLIVNPAAYTSVDRAESEAGMAMRINAEAPEVMAEEARKLGAAMIHYSTDYVLDGTKTTPYTEDDEPNPQNTYGRSKLMGEQAIQASGVAHLILRTSWVYGSRGNNFLLTVLKLAQEREELRIVGDQYGAPTWCRTVAGTTAQILRQAIAAADWRQWWREKTGIYGLTAQGKTTWHGFAVAILANASLEKMPAVVPISTNDYPTPAERPQYSVLSCKKLEKTFGLTTLRWNDGLRLCMQDECLFV